MKLLTLLLFFSYLVICSFSTFAADHTWSVPIVEVVDGDTIETKILSLPWPLSNFKVRITGIDAPERGALAKCEKERQIGKRATEKLTELIGDAKTMTLKNFKHDKYGGRINAEVIVNNINLGNKMLEIGYAKPYDGFGPKPNWCEQK